MRNTTKRITHRSVLRDWISLFISTWVCNIYNINRWSSNFIYRRVGKTTLNTLETMSTVHLLITVIDDLQIASLMLIMIIYNNGNITIK